MRPLRVPPSHHSFQQRHEDHSPSIPAGEPLWHRPGRDVVRVVLVKHLDAVLQNHSLPTTLPQLGLRQLPNLTARTMSSNTPCNSRSFRLRPLSFRPQTAVRRMLVLVVELVQTTDTSASRRRSTGNINLTDSSHARGRHRRVPDFITKGPRSEEAQSGLRFAAQFWVRGDSVCLHGGSEGFGFDAAGGDEVDGGLGDVLVGRGGEGV